MYYCSIGAIGANRVTDTVNKEGLKGSPFSIIVGGGIVINVILKKGYIRQFIRYTEFKLMQTNKTALHFAGSY